MSFFWIQIFVKFKILMYKTIWSLCSVKFNLVNFYLDSKIWMHNQCKYRVQTQRCPDNIKAYPVGIQQCCVVVTNLPFSINWHITDIHLTTYVMPLYIPLPAHSMSYTVYTCTIAIDTYDSRRFWSGRLR